MPFDLKTDRYLEYNPDDPGGSREDLAERVRQSLMSDNVDSPVFLLLPALEPTDPEKFRRVPVAFREAVATARRIDDLPMLAVLGEEASEFDWGLAGLRLIARAQFGVGAWADARATCEAIRDRRPEDTEANLLLGTVYNRLGEPVASTVALERIMSGGGLKPGQEAEARALKGRNLKRLWISDWEQLPGERRQGAALRSAHLASSRKAYDEAFLIDQNHWYSGVNALAMLIVNLRLAELGPDAWSERFADEHAARSALSQLESERDDLAATVRRSLVAESFRTRPGTYDVWADLTRADLRLLTSDKPGFVAAAYEDARARLAAEGSGTFPAESAAEQIRLYLKLGLFTDNARAALTALGVPEEAPEPKPRARVIVFSGHRLDVPGRAEPRFPPGSADTAAEMIGAAISAEKELAGSVAIEGIAGGASGADILFHEICAELGIPTTLMLALPRDDFAAASVADAGPDWVERFRALTKRLEVKLLPQNDDLGSWLAAHKDYSVWQRNNRWMIHTALSRAETDVSLLVLWDGKGGDGPGGTQDMVKLAESRGVRIVHLPASRLIA